MVNHLPDLNYCIPIMWSEVFLAVWALGINFNEFNHLSLLHLNFVIDIFPDVYFELESFGMWFGPYKFGVKEMNFVESFNFFKKEFHHFLAFSMAVDPWRSFKSLAEPAVFDLVSG